MSTASVYGRRTNSLSTMFCSVVEHRRVDALVEELHVLRAAFQHVADDALEERLGQVHVVVELEEGHLRLDHPELGQVARRVGVLGAERRPEGVAPCPATGEDLRLELAADGQRSPLAEEVVRVVDLRRSADAVVRAMRGAWPGRAW